MKKFQIHRVRIYGIRIRCLRRRIRTCRIEKIFQIRKLNLQRSYSHNQSERTHQQFQMRMRTNLLVIVTQCINDTKVSEDKFPNSIYNVFR